MKFFKRLLVICIIMLTVFFASCKKCGKNKEESGGAGSSSGGSIPVDASGNLNYNLPTKSNLASSKEKVLKTAFKIGVTGEYPSLSDEDIEKKAEEELKKSSEEELDLVISILEEGGATINQLETILKLFRENKKIIRYLQNFNNGGLTEILDDENYSQALKFLQSLKSTISKEQLGVCAAFAIYSSSVLYEDEAERLYEISYNAFPNKYYILSDINNYYETISGDKIKFTTSNYYYSNPIDSKEKITQMYIMMVDIYYRGIDALLSLDQDTSKQVIKVYYYYSHSNYESLAINVKNNLKVVAAFADKFLSTFNDKAIKTIFTQLKNESVIEYGIETIYLLDGKSFPICVDPINFYKFRPLVECAISALQDDKILTKISDYIEKLVDTKNEETSIQLSLYCIEVMINQYDKLSQSDKKQLNEAFKESIPSGINYSVDKLVSTVKSVISNSELDDMEKIEQISRKLTNEFVEADNGGVVISPEEIRSYHMPMVKKGTLSNELYEIFGEYAYYWGLRYSSGNLEYNIMNTGFEIINYNTTTTGIQSATLSINGSEVKVNYYVYGEINDYEIIFYEYDIEEFYFAVGQPNITLCQYYYSNPQIYYIYLDFYIEEINDIIHIDREVNVNDITFYNVNINNVGSGLAYASIEDDEYGTLYFPIKYNVLPTTEGQITKLNCNYWCLENYLRYNNYPEIDKEVLANALNENLYAYKYYANKATYYDSFYSRYNYNYEGITITSSNIKSYEIQNRYLHIVINYMGKDYTIRQYLPSEYH